MFASMCVVVYTLHAVERLYVQSKKASELCSHADVGHI